MSERPTPRTDSAIMEIPSKFGSICVVRVELALDLERELGDALQERDELREEVASLRLEAKYYDEADALRKFRERERDEAREQANVMHEQWLSKGRCCENLAEELHEVKQQRDKAIARSKEWSDWCVQYMTERNEAREALMKIKEIFIDGGDTYVDFVKVGNIATDYLEGLWK